VTESGQSLAVRNITISLVRGPSIVEDVSFEVERGHVLGLVGESGSGKTTLSLAPLAYTRPGAHIVSGGVWVLGHNLLTLSAADARAERGRLIAYVPQDPSAALNPSLRVEALVHEMIRAHQSDANSEALVATVLARVGLPNDKAFRRRFPHQLSGGQQQRLAIAIALVCNPSVLVLDEPTTGLDVVTQALVLDEVKRLCRDTGVAIIYVSHDLAVVGEVADEIAVMYAGRIVEKGPSAQIISNPRHPYSRGLVASIPDHLEPRTLRGIPGVVVGVGDRPVGCAFAPRCELRVPECETAVPNLEAVSNDHTVRCIRWRDTPELVLEGRRVFVKRTLSAPLLAVTGLRAEHRTRNGLVVAADDVSFTIAPHECLAIVGESGSGKTTIARCVAGLHAPTSGSMTFDGDLLAPVAKRRTRELRRRLQIVFQNPYESLNPKQTVDQTIRQPLRLFDRVRGKQAGTRVLELLDQVRLPRRLATSFPSELSGGERQRVAIARALAARPDLLICDEVTSALDVSVQAVVLNLLTELRRDLGLALLFITHDLGVVASISDYVLVLERGSTREEGSVEQVLSSPTDEYTRRLLASAPSLVRTASLDHDAGRAR
jgi:peptide/nickel transport system ATP-binding protein